MLAQKPSIGPDALSNSLGGSRILRSSSQAIGTTRLKAPPLPQMRLRDVFQGLSIEPTGTVAATTGAGIEAHVVPGLRAVNDRPHANNQHAVFPVRQPTCCVGSRKTMDQHGQGEEALTIQFDGAHQHTQQTLDAKKAALRNTREELGIAKEELKEMQEELVDLTKCLQVSNASKEQYRNWWINEVQFTKLILNKVLHPNQDWDLIRASQSHYLGRF
ncbi:hypothetical protein BKA70DRAFT_1446089 [Coprinopsis sp. MPI-PUGE-AT-0042]|nr:hypothetical protein BKA70DRAFT_1446089 [Coprinopsis sp. MPI-PUGE-AT-0042]